MVMKMSKIINEALSISQTRADRAMNQSRLESHLIDWGKEALKWECFE